MSDRNGIPTGRLGRGKVVGSTVARVGLKKAAHLTRQPFRRKVKRQLAKIRNDEEIAKLIFDALSKLRGTALKAAQLMAMEVELIPEAYRDELLKAASQVPGLNRALVRSIITRELGPPQQAFRQFASTPFAAASIGQVHEATTHAGERVATKVQYPGMAESVDADLGMLSSLLSVTRYRHAFDECIEHVREKLHEELDYEIEAEHTRWFSRNLARDGVVVPDVSEDLSTRRVLTTTFIDGDHLEPWLKSEPSQARRDHYGQLLVDLFNHTMFDRKTLHADPNPGNYLFRPDGRLGLIDYGCVVRLDPTLVDALWPVFAGEPRSTPRLIEQLHNQLGIHYRPHDGHDEAFDTFLSEWSDWISIPYQTETFDFSRCTDYFARGKQLARQFYKRLERYEGTFVYFGRAQHGLLRLLQGLGATVRMAPRNASHAP